MKSTVTTYDDLVIVQGPYNEISGILDFLKGMRFRWIPTEKHWEYRSKNWQDQFDVADMARKELQYAKTAPAPVDVHYFEIAPDLGKIDKDQLDTLNAALKRVGLAQARWAKDARGRWVLAITGDRRKAEQVFFEWTAVLRQVARPSSPRPSGKVTEAQLRILNKIREADWQDMDAGQGSYKPNSFEGISAAEASRLIDDYLGVVRGRGSRRRY